MTFNGQKLPRPEALMFHSFVALKEVTQSSYTNLLKNSPRTDTEVCK